MSAAPVHRDDQAPAAAIALHPERTGDPATLRWQVAGPLLDDPPTERLDALVRHGVLAAYTAGQDHVTTTLADGRSWSASAALVRDAVTATVDAARRAVAADPDAALTRAARRVLREVAPYAAGHGGAITLHGVRDGVVEVGLTGACHGCPAAGFTVQGRIARRLSAEIGFAEVRVGSQGPKSPTHAGARSAKI